MIFPSRHKTRYHRSVLKIGAYWHESIYRAKFNTRVISQSSLHRSEALRLQTSHWHNLEYEGVKFQNFRIDTILSTRESNFRIFPFFTGLCFGVKGRQCSYFTKGVPGSARMPVHWRQIEYIFYPTSMCPHGQYAPDCRPQRVSFVSKTFLFYQNLLEGTFQKIYGFTPLGISELFLAIRVKGLNNLSFTLFFAKNITKTSFPVHHEYSLE